MRRFTSLIAAAAVVAALTGCTSAPVEPDADHLPSADPVVTEPAPEPEAPEEPEPTPSSEPAFGERIVNDRGNVIKEVGQLAGLTLSNSDDTAAQLVVTDIVVDIDCTNEFADPAQNGHLLGIHLNVETTPALAQDPYPSLSFSEYGWVAFDADDKRVNDPIGNGPYCMATSDQLPYDIGPAQSVSGWVVLDVPTEHGSVALTMGAPTGWEWSY
ncbi:hypothetical protein ACQ143_00255 [Microbacterium sp. MC2]